MNKSSRPNELLEWSTPKLRRIEAGSAEAQAKGVKNDGGTGTNKKS
jgi:hypothetical protein